MLNDLLDIKTAKILIVDDDKVNLDLVRELLRQSGFSNIFITQDFQKGLEYFQSNILDLVLLGVDKITSNTLKLIKAFKLADYCLNPPVIVMSSSTEKKNRLNILGVGAKDYLCKPCDLDELLIRANNLLEMNLAHKEIAEHNNTLESIIKARTKDLRDTQKEIIERLSIASEYKDTDGSSIT